MQDFLTNCANVLQKYGFSYLRGAGTTLLLALVGTFFGCLIGFAVGALQTIPIDKQRDPAWKRVLLRILRVVLRCYVELFRGTPMMRAGRFHLLRPAAGVRHQNGHVDGRLSSSYPSTPALTWPRSVRGGIISIDPGQTEGAKAIGMNHCQTMTAASSCPRPCATSCPRSATTSSSTSRIPRCCSVIGITDLFFVHKSVRRRAVHSTSQAPLSS